MNELLYSCSSALLQPATPVCATVFGDRIVTVVIAKTMLWTDVPDSNDINTAWTAGSVMVLEKIVNGHRIFQSAQEIEVIHKEQKDKVYRIEGKTRKINEALSRATERLTRYPVLYVWYITDKNYCFGGYEVYPNFSLRMFEGKGVPMYISFSFDFVDIGIDYSNYDSLYQYMPQYVETGSVTADSTLITVDSTLITSDQT